MSWLIQFIALSRSVALLNRTSWQNQHEYEGCIGIWKMSESKKASNFFGPCSNQRWAWAADRRRLAAAVFRRPCIARGSGGFVFQTFGIKNRPHGELVEPSTINWPILAERTSRGFCATFSAARPTRESTPEPGSPEAASRKPIASLLPAVWSALGMPAAPG
jgi:hypothetical protein